MIEPVASPGSRAAVSPVRATVLHRDTVVMVRWALTITCAYLVLFSEQSSGTFGFGPAVIVAFLASNLLIGRLPAQSATTPRFNLGIAALDSVLIAASLYCAGQLSVELVVLLLGVLVLAIAGLQLGVIAALTIGLATASLLMVWANGGQPMRYSGMLLRVPFLLAAALIYAWLAEAGRRAAPQDAHASEVINDLARDLSWQFEAIQRCQAVMSQGLVSAAQSVLAEIADQNRAMRAIAGSVHQVAVTEAHSSPAVARGVA